MNTILPKAPDGTSDQVSTKAGEVQITFDAGPVWLPAFLLA
jgi:hypothetical protein